MYFNEHEVGQAIREKIADGTVRREDIFYCGKVMHSVTCGVFCTFGCFLSSSVLSSSALEHLSSATVGAAGLRKDAAELKTGLRGSLHCRAPHGLQGF